MRAMAGNPIWVHHADDLPRLPLTPQLASPMVVQTTGHLKEATDLLQGSAARAAGARAPTLL